MPTDLIATFDLDEAGQPRFIRHGDRKHYGIRLRIAEPPPDTYAVTYLLHETYYDPVRESRDRVSGFAEDLTSYGDFTVQAKIRTRDGVQTVATPLSRALTDGHAPNLTPPIASAIEEIRRW